MSERDRHREFVKKNLIISEIIKCIFVLLNGFPIFSTTRSLFCTFELYLNQVFFELLEQKRVRRDNVTNVVN